MPVPVAREPVNLPDRPQSYSEGTGTSESQAIPGLASPTQAGMKRDVEISHLWIPANARMIGGLMAGIDLRFVITSTGFEFLVMDGSPRCVPHIN